MGHCGKHPDQEERGGQVLSQLIQVFISVHAQWEVFNTQLLKKVLQWVSSGGAAAPPRWWGPALEDLWLCSYVSGPCAAWGQHPQHASCVRGLQTPLLLQADSKHAVSNHIIEGDGAPESCPTDSQWICIYRKVMPWSLTDWKSYQMVWKPSKPPLWQ